MNIEVAVEHENAFVNIVGGNFPVKFTFMDRTTKMLVHVNLDYDAFTAFVKSLESKVDLKKMHELDAVLEANK